MEIKIDKLSLPKLPYELNALEPFISAQAMDYHYNTLHAAYVVKINSLIKDTKLENEDSFFNLITKSKEQSLIPLFNNLSQHWNHSFFWNVLSLNKQISKNSSLHNQIVKQYDSMDGFISKFTDMSGSHFGSGWIWLVLNKNTSELELMTTPNGDNPMAYGHLESSIIMGCDLWEHAYYIDYRNKKADYANAVVKNTFNWEYISERYDNA